MSVTDDLELARNLHGRLTPKLRARVLRALLDPDRWWDDAHGIVVGGDGWTTLWQAVLAVDPTFPQSHPYGSPWERVPTPELIRDAIRYATH